MKLYSILILLYIYSHVSIDVFAHVLIHKQKFGKQIQKAVFFEIFLGF